MELRTLATFEDRNMLSLIFLVCVKYLLGLNRHFLETLLNHSGFFSSAPKAENYNMTLRPERFKVVKQCLNFA